MCSSDLDDPTETDPDGPECDNGIDDDGDGDSDFPDDEDCDGPTDDDESAECSDEQDNDGDNLTDADDPGCHTDGDPGNPGSYDPNDDSEEDVPACSDTGDNDGDGLTDIDDPGCHTDGDPSNPDSYDPNDNDEEDEPECSDGGDNDGDGKTDFPEDLGCSGPDDDDESDKAYTTRAPLSRGRGRAIAFSHPVRGYGGQGGGQGVNRGTEQLRRVVTPTCEASWSRFGTWPYLCVRVTAPPYGAQGHRHMCGVFDARWESNLVKVVITPLQRRETRRPL